MELGVTPRMIQRRTAAGAWVALHRGVFCDPSSPATSEQALLGHLLAAGPSALATSVSAAWLWDLSDEPHHVVILMKGNKARSVQGATIRVCPDIPRIDRTLRKSVPVTSVDRTVIESARDLDEQRLTRILEEALRKGLTRVDRIEKRLQALNPKGRRGTKCLQSVLSALADGEPPTESELESAFRRLCKRAGLSPSRQVWVRDKSSIIGRADFAFTECKVIVEVDGHRWHSIKSDIERDRVKEARLSAAGWVVIRFTWDQIRNHPEMVVAALRRTLIDRSPMIQGVLVPNPP